MKTALLSAIAAVILALTAFLAHLSCQRPLRLVGTSDRRREGQESGRVSMQRLIFLPWIAALCTFAVSIPGVACAAPASDSEIYDIVVGAGTNAMMIVMVDHYREQAFAECKKLQARAEKFDYNDFAYAHINFCFGKYYEFTNNPRLACDYYRKSVRDWKVLDSPGWQPPTKMSREALADPRKTAEAMELRNCK